MLLDRFVVFFVTWTVLVLANGLFLWKGSPAAKRAWFPRIAILECVIFVAFTYWVAPHALVLCVVVPIAAVMAFLNVRTIRFCASCGAVHQSFGPFRAHDGCCRKCGTDLS